MEDRGLNNSRNKTVYLRRNGDWNVEGTLISGREF